MTTQETEIQGEDKNDGKDFLLRDLTDTRPRNRASSTKITANGLS